jgi:GST-like protein
MPVQLYFFPTPNGRKISIALEEMHLDYEIRMVDIFQLQQTRPEFLRLSPNARIPALLDPDVAGEPVVIFESGAILQYLGRKSGRFYPTPEAKRSWVDAWLFWQMAGLGPMTGQLTWFKRANAKPGRDPRDCSLPLHRYEKEMRRLYQVLETQLLGREFICDEYSIADMACWPWVNQHHDYLGDLRQFRNIFAWHERIGARPAVQKAMQAGTVARPT